MECIRKNPAGTVRFYKLDDVTYCVTVSYDHVAGGRPTHVTRVVLGGKNQHRKVSRQVDHFIKGKVAAELRQEAG